MRLTRQALRPPTSRLTLEELYRCYSTPEEALVAGDFGWVCRFARSDTRLVGEALVLLGNSAGGLRLLEGCQTTPRATWCRIWAQSLLGEANSAELDRLEKEHGRNPWTEVLRRHLNPEPLQVLLVSNTTADRNALWKRTPNIVIKTARYLGGPADCVIDPARPILDAIGRDRCDLVVLDTLHILPAGLADLKVPIVAFIADLEWNYAAQPAAYDQIDAIFAVSSQVHREMRERFGRPTFVYPFWNYYGFVDVNSKLLRQHLHRQTDVFYSGRTHHAHGLYPEKPWWLYPILTLPSPYKVVLEENFLGIVEYASAMGRAKFVPAVVRHSNATSWRALEAWSAGAFVLHDEASLAPHVWSQDYHCCFPMGTSAADLLPHLERFAAYRERFAEKVDLFEEELRSINPGPLVGTNRVLKHAAFIADLARIGFPDQFLGSKKLDTGRYLAPRVHIRAGNSRFGGGAAAPNESDALVQTYFLFLGEGVRPATQTLRGLAQRAAKNNAYDGAVYHLSLYHLLRKISSYGWHTALALADTYASRFPRSALFAYLQAVANFELKRTETAEKQFLELAKTINVKTFAPVDGLLAWHEPIFKPFELTDAIIRDSLAHRNDGDDLWRCSRNVLHSHCETYLAKLAADAGRIKTSGEHVTRAISLHSSNVAAVSLWLEAFWREKPQEVAESSQGYEMTDLVHGNIDLFLSFAPNLAVAELRSGLVDRARQTLRLWFLIYGRWQQNGAPKALSEVTRAALIALSLSGELGDLALRLDELLERQST